MEGEDELGQGPPKVVSIYENTFKIPFVPVKLPDIHRFFSVKPDSASKTGNYWFTFSPILEL